MLLPIPYDPKAKWNKKKALQGGILASIILIPAFIFVLWVMFSALFSL